MPGVSMRQYAITWELMFIRLHREGHSAVCSICVTSRRHRVAARRCCTKWHCKIDANQLSDIPAFVSLPGKKPLNLHAVEMPYRAGDLTFERGAAVQSNSQKHKLSLSRIVASQCFAGRSNHC